MTQIKPSVFIGSSKGALRIAQAIYNYFDHTNIAEAYKWTDKIFKLSNTTYSDLLKASKQFDFAIFVFLPEDEIIVKGETVLKVRDNVIFEAGLFLGSIGKERVFAIQPNNIKETHIPTDLKAVYIGDYNIEINDLDRAVSRFCSYVHDEIIKLKSRHPKWDNYIFEGLHHVNITVRNNEISKKFYSDILKLKEIERPDFGFPGTWFGLPNGQHLHLVENPSGTFRKLDIKASIVEQKLTKEDAIKPKDTHFALILEYERWREIDELLAKHKLEHIKPFATKLGLLQLYILDPDGHIIELTALTNAQQELHYKND